MAWAAAIAGAGIQIWGQYEAAKGARRQFEQRASSYELDAIATEKQTDYEVSQMEAEARMLRARQRVQIAKSGVLPGGSPKIVMDRSRDKARRDIAFRKEGGAVTAQRLRSQAANEREMARRAYRAGILGGTTTALTSGYQLYQFGRKSG